MATGRVAGTTIVSVDGNQLSLKGSISCAFGENERESVMGLDGRHGWKEKKVTPFIEITCTMTEDLDINTLEAVTNSTVQVEMANGKRGVLSGATQVNQATMNPEEGEVTFRFEGESGTYS